MVSLIANDLDRPGLYTGFRFQPEGHGIETRCKCGGVHAEAVLARLLCFVKKHRDLFTHQIINFQRYLAVLGQNVIESCVAAEWIRLVGKTQVCCPRSHCCSGSERNTCGAEMLNG
jgi:hypothetical protein